MDLSVLWIAEQGSIEGHHCIGGAPGPREGDALDAQRAKVIRVFLEERVQAPRRILVLPKSKETPSLADEELGVPAIQEEAIVERLHRVRRTIEVEKDRAPPGERDPVPRVQGEGVVERR